MSLHLDEVNLSNLESQVCNYFKKSRKTTIVFPPLNKKYLYRNIEIEKKFESFIRDVNPSDNIYAFISDKNELLYVGKSGSQKYSRTIRNRLRQHLIRKPLSTHSKREKVKEYCKIHESIKIITFEVEPKEYISFVESILINKLDFKWNKRID